MSSHDGADINAHFLSSEEVELRPLLAEAEETLDLDSVDLLELEAFLSEAWLSGVRASHSRLLEQATRRETPIGPVEMAPIESEFKALMKRTADGLNLSVTRTIITWGLLGRAWVGGTRCYQSEVAAQLLEGKSDIGQEVLEWLEKRRP